MKEIKFLLFCLYIALYTSLWWMAFSECCSKPPLIIMIVLLLIIGTGANVIWSFLYCCKNWNDDKKINSTG